MLNGSIIKNVAVWDGIQVFNPGVSTADITGRHVPKIGDTLQSRPSDATHNIVIDGNSITIAQWSGVSHTTPGGYNACQNACLELGLTVNDFYNASINGQATNS